MIVQNFGYHTHSTYSDGRNSLADMIEQAINLGWDEIGFSDHLIVHKDMKKSANWPVFQTHYASYIYRDSFSEAKADFHKYKEEINLLRQKYPIKIYIGAEVDYFTYDGWLDEFIDFRNELKLDYYVSGNHYLIDDNHMLIDPDAIDRIIPDTEEQKRLISRHFATIGKAAKSGLFDFVAHMDYMRRVKICTPEAFYADKMKLISTLAQTGTPAEISTKGIVKFGEPFPCRWMMEELCKQNVPVVISDDAHNTSRIGENFVLVENMLKEMNCTNRWKLNRK